MPQDGDPVVEQNNTETVGQEAAPVLSKETEVPAEKVEIQEPAQGKSPEQRFKNSQWAQARIKAKELKEADPEELFKEASVELGFDPEKEENKQAIKLQASFEKKKRDADLKRKNQLSNATLCETFERIGIDPTSEEAQIFGSRIIRKFNVENPNIFEDDNLVNREIERIRGVLGGKKEVKDTVNESILRKASSSLPQKQSPKGASAPSEDKELEAGAASMGVSKEKYKTLKEKQKNMPKWA